MASWFGNQKSKDRKKSREESLKAALASSEALEKAAKGTMNLAQDVTTTLQAKIGDYITQIDQTAILLSDALIYVDSQGNVESFNPAAEHMFGWKRRQIIGKPVSTLFQFKESNIDDSQFIESLLGGVKNEDSNLSIDHEDFMGVCSDGRMIYIDVGASKITGSDGKIFYIILIRDVTNRVNQIHTIKDLAERNRELLTTIDSSLTGFCILQPNENDYQISFVNEGMAKITGDSRENILHMNLRKLIGVEKEYWTVRRMLSEKNEGHCEIQLVGENWFDVHITPVFKNNLAVQWILVFYDITQLKKANDDLRRREAHFRAFSEASRESMFIHDSHSLLDWNDRLARLTGYSEKDLRHINPLDFVHPLEREEIRNRLVTSDPDSYETLFVTKNGEVREIAINSRPIEWENAEAQIVVARDVTEFKDIETQLRSSRERYRTVIDNTIDLIVCFNSDFEITFSNQTFRDYFDIEIEDTVGFKLLSVIPSSDHIRFKDYMLSIRPDTEIRRGIHRVERNGEIRWQDWIDRGIFDPNGKLIEIQSVARDITHLMPSQ